MSVDIIAAVVLVAVAVGLYFVFNKTKVKGQPTNPAGKGSGKATKPGSKTNLK